MEDWAAELRQDRPEAAWDLLLSRYRRLIFAAIRHFVAWGLVVAAVGFYAIRRERIELRKTSSKRG